MNAGSEARFESSPGRFIISGAAALGIGLALGAVVIHLLDDTRLGIAASGVFFGLSVRNLIFALFIPSQLTVRTSASRIEGPNLFFLFWVQRRAIEWTKMDWEESFRTGRTIQLYAADRTRIHLKLSWYRPEDAKGIVHEIESRLPEGVWLE